MPEGQGDFQIEDGLIMAQVRGSVNPYFGVYKELSTPSRLSLSPSALQIGQPRSPTLPPSQPDFPTDAQQKCLTISKMPLPN